MPCFRGPLGCPGADGSAVVDDAHDPFFASERAFKASTAEDEAIIADGARLGREGNRRIRRQILAVAKGHGPLRTARVREPGQLNICRCPSSIGQL
jgi:hypothetical protein